MPILKKFMNAIYNGFDAKREIEPNMYNELLRIMNEASVQGLSLGNFSIEHNREFLQAIRHSNEVFAAFKTHKMGISMQARLLDSRGQLKPFYKWAKDVKSIASHHVNSWLKTEYNTAVLRAHNAADWREFLANKDILPNLRWMPTTSPNAEATHRGFWEKKLTLPIEHPFWNKHHPGDRWNCKCALEATDEPESPHSVLADIPDIKPQAGLENNPGKDGRIFNDTHPYFPKNCNSCAFYKKGGVRNKLKMWFTNKEKDCFNCDILKYKIPNSNGFIKERVYPNGGKLFIHSLVDRTKPDYNAIKNIANSFAKLGDIVELTPAVHFKSEEYQKIYRDLIGTSYERKCPDLRRNGIFYEYEGFIKPWTKKKVGRMLSHGLEQSPYIIIDNTKGCSDRFLRKQIKARLNTRTKELKEVWIYEKGNIRQIYDNGNFYK